MTTMNPNRQKVKMLTGLAEIFRFEFSEITMQLYLDALKELSVDGLKRILSYGIKSNAWNKMPFPGQILAQIHQDQESKVLLNSSEQFQKILRSVRSYGRNKIPDVSETSLQALRMAGGINRLADASDEELHWIQKDFISNFQLVEERSRLETRQHLIGSPKDSEQINNTLKFLTNRLSMDRKLPTEKDNKT